MNRYSLSLIVVFLLLLVPLSGFNSEWQDLFEQMGSGSINWSKAMIISKGIGAPPPKYYGMPNARPMALRAARLEAMRNILEVINGMRIDSTTVVRNLATKSEDITAKVEGMIKKAKIVKQEYMSDGTLEVTMEMNLLGEFTQLILPSEIKHIETVTPVKQNKRPLSISTSGIYTGLVVNAKGLRVKPALAPKILDENGQEIYGASIVSREFAVQQGMSGYTKDLQSAQLNPRVSNNPLTVKGLRAEGIERTDIIVSNADASLIRSSSENLYFLKKCRVMIVLE